MSKKNLPPIGVEVYVCKHVRELMGLGSDCPTFMSTVKGYEGDRILISAPTPEGIKTVALKEGYMWVPEALESGPVIPIP